MHNTLFVLVWKVLWLYLIQCYADTLVFLYFVFYVVYKSQFPAGSLQPSTKQICIVISVTQLCLCLLLWSHCDHTAAEISLACAWKASSAGSVNKFSGFSVFHKFQNEKIYWLIISKSIHKICNFLVLSFPWNAESIFRLD